LSTLGHPLSDLANLLVVFYIDTIPGQHGLGNDTELLSVVNVKYLITLYCSKTGTQFSDEEWIFAVAFSFFRIAVISQGITARAFQNRASSTNANIYAEIYQWSMNMALDIIGRNSQSKL
jgi:aminoglycoside phosphotransferase (APT) family kinase protein